MFEEFLPKKKIGVLSPLAVIDNSAYEFYQLVPRGIMMVTVPLIGRLEAEFGKPVCTTTAAVSRRR
jgi:hypothetical protein